MSVARVMVTGGALEREDTLVAGSSVLSERDFARLAALATSELGIQLSPIKLPMLQSRLMRRLRQLQIGSMRDYCDYLFSSEGAEQERIHFLDAVTTNKTDFFREPTHFDYLLKTALPTIERTIPAQGLWRFTLWCAGCSSGEEAYTQAMLLDDYTKRRANQRFAILATDISTRVLKHARLGIYTGESAAPIPPAFRSAYLLRSKEPGRNLVRILPDLRKKISFHRLNFMSGNYAIKQMFHVIFFRNVMIYFDRPTQEAVLRKLCANLLPGGYLFVGHSESLNGMDVPVYQVSAAVFQKPL